MTLNADPLPDGASDLERAREHADPRMSDAALREHGARMSAVFAQAAVGLSEIALDGRFQRVNDALCAMLGRSREALLAAGVADVVDPGDAALTLERFGRVVETGAPAALDTRYRRPDGAVVWANSSLTRLTDAQGRAQAVLAVTVDLTARHTAEGALRASEEFNRRVLASSADCIKVLDLDGRVEFMSEGGLCVMEVDAFEDIAGFCWPELWQGSEHPKALAAVETARRGGAGRFQGFATTMKGAPRWWDVIVTPIAGPDGRPERLLSITRDVTAVKQAEERLRALNATLESRVAERTEQRDRLALIVETSDLMMIACDFAFGILAINRSAADAFAHVYGVRPEVGDNLLALLADRPEDQAQVRAAWSRGLAGEEGVFVEDFGIADRARTSYEIKFRILRNAAGERVGAYQFVTDVTERRRQERQLQEAQEALRQSQKVEALGQLTGGIAHDFNNLLTVIRSSADLLRRRDLPEERRRRYVDAISDTADRAAKLTGQLLAFARRQALRPEVFEAADRVRGVAEMLGTLLGPRITLKIEAGDDGSVEADVAQFETALVNMAINARDAMGGEGELTLAVRGVCAMPAVRGHAGAAGDFVAISVTDTGCGIAPEHMERIFEPFFTTKGVGRGTGLGLSQLFGFAKQSGGEVDVRSALGAGTTFTLYLPRADATLAVAAIEPTPEGPLGRVRVLVVEDNEEVGEFATQLLADLGYQTTFARNAGEALRILGRGPGAFDVVLSDVVMPGMSGVELGKEVRARWPDLPVVLTSGYSHVLAEDAHHGFPLLQKPYSVEALSHVLRVACSPLRPSDASRPS